MFHVTTASLFFWFLCHASLPICWFRMPTLVFQLLLRLCLLKTSHFSFRIREKNCVAAFSCSLCPPPAQAQLHPQTRSVPSLLSSGQPDGRRRCLSARLTISLCQTTPCSLSTRSPCTASSPHSLFSPPPLRRRTMPERMHDTSCSLRPL